jgi:adenylate cyclase
MKIMANMQVKLTFGKLGRLWATKTNNIKAYEKFLMGWDYFHRRTKGDTLEARKLAQESISLDPEYGAPYILLAETYLDDVWYYKADPEKSLETAESFIQKAVDLSGPNSMTHQTLGSVYFMRREYDRAIIECQKAVELSPNSADAIFYLAHALRWAGRFDEAIPLYTKAIRLNPIKPLNYLNNLAWAYTFTEQYDKAISLWKQTLERNPDYFLRILA